MKNPFDGFYHVLNSQELLDIAFKKAMKISAQVSRNAPILVKAKKKESQRIRTAIKILIRRIQDIVKMVPLIDELPVFYRELASLLVDTEELKLKLGRIHGVLPILNKMQRIHSKEMSQIDTPKDADKVRRMAFGRVSSIINKQNKNLQYLNDIRGRLREIPSLDYTMPCVVMAGHPNVGKSSLVKLISTNKRLDVQEYPFTTKKLSIGHLHVEKRFDMVKVQVMDTPGILDRPMSKRNNIELQAILALRCIADLIFFIFDPTPSSGYSVDSQIELFKEIKKYFSSGDEEDKKIDLIVIFNKMDLARESEIEYLKSELDLTDNNFFLTNALTGENIDNLISFLIERYE